LTFNPEFLKKHGYDKLSDISVLLPQKNREKWEKIGIPSGDIGDGDAIKDDGKKPSAPKSAKKSNDKLTWGKSASNDVVGYRIYRASSSDGDFKLVGNTTSTSYKISNDKAVYYIKAVDYFGLESASTDNISVGGEEKKKDSPFFDFVYFYKFIEILKIKTVILYNRNSLQCVFKKDDKKRPRSSRQRTFEYRESFLNPYRTREKFSSFPRKATSAKYFLAALHRGTSLLRIC